VSLTLLRGVRIEHVQMFTMESVKHPLVFASIEFSMFLWLPSAATVSLWTSFYEAAGMAAPQ